MWSFGISSDWTVRSTPKHLDFFTDADSSAAEDLVRESTQNSQDAGRNGVRPVVVRFRFGELDRSAFAGRYLQGLAKHLVACDPAAQGILAGAGPVPFLVVEDFGTRGLDGPADRVTEDSNYNRFWWSYGESVKEGGDGGRHGVGKSTIAGSSRLRFFLGLTVRADDRRVVLTGQSVLRPHHLPEDGDTWFEPYGFFAATQHPAPPEPFVGPSPEVAAFCSDFGIVRGADPGLSLVIPFPHAQITQEAVLDAVVRNCFHQIASGDLEVHVGGDVLNRDSLAGIVADRHHALAELETRIALSLEVTGPSTPPLLQVVGDFMRDRLSAEAFSPEDLAAARAAWSAGSTLAVRMPVRVLPPGAEPIVGHVALFLRRALSEEQSAETYVRGRVSVTLSPKIAARNAVALLAADPGPISRFLGDAEKPNHRDWVAKRAEARGYRAPNLPLKIIKNALRDLHALATQTDEAQVVKDVLSEFFYTPAPKAGPSPLPSGSKPPPPDASPPAPPDPPAATDPAVPPDLPAEEEALTVSKTRGGFQVVCRGNGAEHADFRVSAAYDVRRGRSKWSSADFDLTRRPIKIRPTGQGMVKAHPDRIVVRGAKAGFRLTVTGFDKNRDLRVRAEMEDLGG